MRDNNVGWGEKAAARGAMPATASLRHSAQEAGGEPAGLKATPVLIVNYRNRKDILACLASLRAAQNEPAMEVFICENGGPGAFEELAAALTAEDGPCVETGLAEPIIGRRFARQCLLRLAGAADAPRVHLAGAEQNLGYAGGVNAWLEPLLAVRGWTAIWILNPDTQPAPDALAELAAHAQHWGKGMVGSRLIPGRDHALVHSRGLAWSKHRAIADSVDLRARADVEPDPERVDARIDAPSGASMYVTRGCIDRIGLMDERYFLYFEDLEWGLRAKAACGVGYAHRSVVVHVGGTTIGRTRRAARRSALSVHLEARNAILFVRATYAGWLPWTIAMQLLRVVRHAHDYPIATSLAALRGVAAGVLGRSGRPDWLLADRARPGGKGP